MTTLLNNWKLRETKLADRRKYLTEKGMTAEAAIAETAVDQKKNNRKYESLWGKGKYRRTVAGIV